jgi:hypothetical protein
LIESSAFYMEIIKRDEASNCGDLKFLILENIG